VQLASSGDLPQIPFGAGLDMVRSGEGVWEVTLGQVDGGAYRYSFTVDGTKVLDPASRSVSESNDTPWSLVHVPGQAFMDTQDVPHGAVSEVTYQSSVLGRARRMHVYTPPGFAGGTGDYPVFYLLHGAMDSDDSWSSVGRAGFILDNLIAAGAAVPMIVVMPHGHTGPLVPGAGGLGLQEFENEFRQDIKPYVETNYPVRTDRANTAIAGLSMGGAHTLDLAFGDLAEYGWVGVYSSGIFSINQNNNWEEAHAATLGDASLKDGLELLWFATGSEDFLLDTSKASVALLQKHQFDVEYVESGGGHTWMNWRDYLHVFAQRLFK
jgi:enterochelin esterase-like enzyme